MPKGALRKQRTLKYCRKAEISVYISIFLGIPYLKGVGNMRRTFAFLCILTLLGTGLAGCRQEPVPKETEPLCRYVTRIDVRWEENGQALHRTYTRDGEMESVLLYLRLLQDDGTVRKPPIREPGGEFTILLSMSDGSSRTCIQRGYQYFCWEDGTWIRIKTGQGRRLGRLLRLMPSNS